MSDFEDRFRLSDLGNLARLARRRVVRTARFQDQPSFAGILRAPTDRPRGPRGGRGVLAPYDLVNVQVGLDAWLAKDGVDTRSSVLEATGTGRFRALATYCTLRSQTSTLPMPGNVARVRLPVGTDGALTSAVLAGVCTGHDRGARRDPWGGAGSADGAGGRSRVRGSPGPSAPGRRPTGRRDPDRGRAARPCGRAQRFPRPGSLLRSRHVRRTGPRRRSSTADHGHGRRGDPSRGDAGDHPAAGRRRGRAPGPAARCRPAPQTRVAPLRATGGGQDALRALPDQPAHRRHGRGVVRRLPGSDRRRPARSRGPCSRR